MMLAERSDSANAWSRRVDDTESGNCKGEIVKGVGASAKAGRQIRTRRGTANRDGDRTFQAYLLVQAGVICHAGCRRHEPGRIWYCLKLLYSAQPLVC